MENSKVYLVYSKVDDAYLYTDAIDTCCCDAETAWFVWDIDGEGYRRKEDLIVQHEV